MNIFSPIFLTNKVSPSLTKFKSVVGIKSDNPTAALTLNGSLSVNSNQIDFTNLPTSDPGVAGRLWRSGNDVKVSTG